MALISCPECENKLSDKAEVCPHCGYPIAKLKLTKPRVRKKKVEDDEIEYADPRFPTLPENLDIGKSLSYYKSKFRTISKIDSKYNFNLDFFWSETIELSIHQSGLKVHGLKSEKHSYLQPKDLDLHYSVIISLKKTNLLHLVNNIGNEEEDVALDCKLIFDSNSFFEGYLLKDNEKELESTSILILNYWNTSLKKPTSLVMLNLSYKLPDFLKSFNEAKSNYERGIPNIPDKKGNRIFIILIVIILLALAIIFLLTIKVIFSDY